MLHPNGYEKPSDEEVQLCNKLMKETGVEHPSVCQHTTVD